MLFDSNHYSCDEARLMPGFCFFIAGMGSKSSLIDTLV
ncbi:hypothetical protein DDI_3121 [Dickeya dianthicola RNS04.9]|nr:hypothetical protein DDI_3121 [Dickeya dianthicola RNS04.9]